MRYNAIGGAFGGREDLSMQHVLALAAWHLRDRFPGRKVALQWSREESIIGHHKRHPMRIQSTWARHAGWAHHGCPHAHRGRRRRLRLNLARGDQVRGSLRHWSLRHRNITTDGYVVYTNNVPSGAFRGFGSPQAHFAAESMVNRLARRWARSGRGPAEKPLPRGQHRADRASAAGGSLGATCVRCRGGRDANPLPGRAGANSCRLTSGVAMARRRHEECRLLVWLSRTMQQPRLSCLAGGRSSKRSSVWVPPKLARAPISQCARSRPECWDRRRQIEMVTDDSVNRPTPDRLRLPA